MALHTAKRRSPLLKRSFLIFAGVALALTGALFFAFRNGDLIWGANKFSLQFETIGPTHPFRNESVLIHSGWDGPTGEFTSGDIFGIKLKNRLLRLNIVHDPIAAIRRQLPTTVPGLLQAVRSKDHLRRSLAAQALVKLGPAAVSAIPELLREIPNGNQPAEFAVVGLAEAGPSNAVPLLIPALADPHHGVRYKVAEALGETGPAALAAVPSLEKALRDYSPMVVITSAVSLRKIDKRDHGEVTALITFLDHRDVELQKAAAAALDEFSADAAPAVEPLLALLKNADPIAATIIIRTLGMIGSSGELVVPVLISLLDSPDTQTSVYAAEALGKFGAAAQPAIPSLVRLTSSVLHRSASINALAAIGPTATPALVDLYRDTPSRGSFQLIKAFISQGSAAAPAVPLLLEDLKSPKPTRAAMAAMALGQLGEPARIAIPSLIDLTQNTNDRTRLIAAQALWRLDRQTNTVLPIALDKLQRWAAEPSALTRKTGDAFGQSTLDIAVQLVTEIGPPARQAIPQLRLMLRSTFPEQTATAASALRNIEPR